MLDPVNPPPFLQSDHDQLHFIFFEYKNIYLIPKISVFYGSELLFLFIYSWFQVN